MIRQRLLSVGEGLALGSCQLVVLEHPSPPRGSLIRTALTRTFAAHLRDLGLPVHIFDARVADAVPFFFSACFFTQELLALKPEGRAKDVASFSREWSKKPRSTCVSMACRKYACVMPASYRNEQHNGQGIQRKYYM